MDSPFFVLLSGLCVMTQCSLMCKYQSFFWGGGGYLDIYFYPVDGGRSIVVS